MNYRLSIPVFAVIFVATIIIFTTKSYAAEHYYIKSIKNPGTTTLPATSEGKNIKYEISFLPNHNTTGTMVVNYRSYGINTDGSYVELASKHISEVYDPVKKPTVKVTLDVDKSCTKDKYVACGFVADFEYRNPNQPPYPPDSHWGYYKPYKAKSK